MTHDAPDIRDPEVIKLLAHPMRVRILGLLEGRVLSTSELADELDAPPRSVSYHVRKLYSLGLIQLADERRRRGAIERYYTAVASATISDETWGKLPTMVKRAALAAQLDHLAVHVTDGVEAGGFEHSESRLSEMPITVDSVGWAELAQELASVFERVSKIGADAARRLGPNAHEAERHANVVMMLFQPAGSLPPEQREGMLPEP